ncbi:hypothetical protein DPMN_092560 [Dreissena polymorpha]|uniref:Uncharacterized protein n=1 Tax=Dreissena polymorpha TaxID=45954 RepID=A0A9D4R0A0_DREPO|nr:hypothetical protein DPMN_092560 [Dreissena polymorpha]
MAVQAGSGKKKARCRPLKVNLMPRLYRHLDANQDGGLSIKVSLRQSRTPVFILPVTENTPLQLSPNSASLRLPPTVEALASCPQTGDCPPQT